MIQKIYITCLHLNHGGIEMAISLLSTALCRRGFDVEILCTYNFGKPAYYIDPKVKITYLTNVLPNKESFKDALNKKNPLKILVEGVHATKVLFLKKHCLKKEISKLDNGIIISTRHEDSLLVSKYGSSSLLKIAQLHHDHHFNNKLFNGFKHGYNNIDYFLLLTDLLREEISNAMAPHNAKTKCVTIPNFLPFEQIPPIQEKEPTVIAVGRLHTDKAFHRLIDAWALVHQKHPEWKLKIVGNGPLEADLMKQVTTLHLNESIIFTGALDHDTVMEEMAKASVYAMTSITEAFPFVLLEAMYNYLPIVAYDVRVGPRAIVLENTTGFLVPDNDTEKFANKIITLIENPDILKDFQLASAQHVQNFSESSVMKLWLNIFSSKDTL